MHRELRALPGLSQAVCWVVGEAIDRDSGLLQGVAIAQGHRAVVHRLVVDGYAPGDADLVLAAVALADRAALVELGGSSELAGFSSPMRGELSLLRPWWWVGKRKGRQRHTQFMDASAEKITRMARDRSFPAALRRKAQAEEKERKLRNRQKRESD